MARASIWLAVMAIASTACSGSTNEVQPGSTIGPDTCFEVTSAVERGDGEVLSRFGLPASIDSTLIDPTAITGRFCSSDNLNEEYVMVVSRASGQVVIARNTTEDMIGPSKDHPAVLEAALDAAGSGVGLLVVDGDTVLPVGEAHDREEAAPIAVLFG
jgi:hypothetical protein